MALGEDDVYVGTRGFTPGIMAVTPELGTTPPHATIDGLLGQTGDVHRKLLNSSGDTFIAHINTTSVNIKDMSGNTVTSISRWGASSEYHMSSISENKKVFAVLSFYYKTSNTTADPYIRVSVFNMDTLVWKYFSDQGIATYGSSDLRYYHVSLNSDGSKITFSYRDDIGYINYFKMLLTSDMLTDVLPILISASSCKDDVIWMNNDDDLLLCPVGGGTAQIYNFTSDTLTNTITVGNVYKSQSYPGQTHLHFPSKSQVILFISGDPHFKFMDTTDFSFTFPKSRDDSGMSLSFTPTHAEYFKDLLITTVAGYPGVVSYKQDPLGQWEPYSIVQTPICDGIIIPATETPKPYKFEGDISESFVANEWVATAFFAKTRMFAGVVNFTGTAFTIELTYPDPIYITIAANQGNIWVADTLYQIGDKVFPTDPVSTPYYYESTTGGTTALSEPSWGITPGSTVLDGSVTWAYVERLIQPLTQGPVIPVVV